MHRAQRSTSRLPVVEVAARSHRPAGAPRPRRRAVGAQRSSVAALRSVPARRGGGALCCAGDAPGSRRRRLARRLDRLPLADLARDGDDERHGQAATSDARRPGHARRLTHASARPMRHDNGRHRAWGCHAGRHDCTERRAVEAPRFERLFPRPSRFPPHSKDGPFGLLEGRMRPVSVDSTGRCEPRCVPGLAVRGEH